MVRGWQSRQNTKKLSKMPLTKPTYHTKLSRHCSTPNPVGTPMHHLVLAQEVLASLWITHGLNTGMVKIGLTHKPVSRQVDGICETCKTWWTTWPPRTKNRLNIPWRPITPDLVPSNNTVASHHIQKPKTMCQPSWTVHKSISLRIARPLAAQQLATLGLVNGLTHCPVARRRPVLVPAHAPQEQSVISTPQIMVAWTSPLVAAQLFLLQPIWKSPRLAPTNTKANTSLDA